MIQNYKCSIFCSLFKGQNFIDGYMSNILEQTIFNDTEFLILDCDSPQNEKEKILPLSQQYPNIKYVRLDKDPGLYAAWNIAIKMCSAPIIGNWNVDDRKPCNGLEILYKRLERKPQVDIVYGITYISTTANEKYEDNEYDKVYPYLPHSLNNLLQNNSPHCMPLWRKNIHDRFGYFDESYMSAADGEFWLRCAFAGAILELVNHPVGLYYHNPDGVSTNPENLQKCLAEVRRSREMYLKQLNRSK